MVTDTRRQSWWTRGTWTWNSEALWMFDHNSRNAHFALTSLCYLRLELEGKKKITSRLHWAESSAMDAWDHHMLRVWNMNHLTLVATPTHSRLCSVWSMQTDYHTSQKLQSSRIIDHEKITPAAASAQTWIDRLQLLPILTHETSPRKKSPALPKKKKSNLIDPILYIMHCRSQVSDLTRYKNKELIILVMKN